MAEWIQEESILLNNEAKSQLRSLNESKHFDALALEDSVFTGVGDFDYFNHPCLPENRELLALFPRGFYNRTVLDLGCGLGEAAFAFAGRGATVHGVDVSQVSLSRATEIASQKKRAVNYVCVTDSKLPFDSNSHDLVYGNGILHHLELEPSLREIRRVLKPGGVGFFIEPSIGNPLISIYRLWARTKRSKDEKPLSNKEYALINRYFLHTQRIAYQTCTQLVFFKMLFLEAKSPNQTSYWREPILHPNRYKSIYRWASRMDNRLRKFAPKVMQQLCWNNVIIVKK